MKRRVQPLETGWFLPEDACQFLARLVAAHKPALIVEAGSGGSTIAFAKALRKLGAGKVVALEHDKRFFAQTSALLSPDLAGYAEVRYAPLEPHGQQSLTPNWYARDAWNDLDGIGLLLVDGPPGKTSRFARHPALPLLRDRLLPGCVVVLDDLNRPDEKTSADDWGIALTRLDHAKATLGYGVVDA